MNKNKEIEDYFLRKSSQISMRQLQFEKDFQNELALYVAKNFEENDIKLRLIELIATMKINSELPFDILNNIYLLYTADRKDLASAEKTMFANDFIKYMKNNTEKSEDDILNAVTMIFEALSSTYKAEENYAVEDNFNEEINFALEVGDLIFDKKDVEDIIPAEIKNNTRKRELRDYTEPKDRKKIKNLNPTKMANMCIAQGIPADTKDLIDNIEHNKQFPRALVSAMANIAAIKEIKAEINVAERNNYFKIFKLLDKDCLVYGFSTLINNFKELANSDRIVLRFFNIWIEALKNYDNMNNAHKEIVIEVFKKETKENMDRYRAARNEHHKKKVDGVNNKKENEFFLNNIEIEPKNVNEIRSIISMIKGNEKIDLPEKLFNQSFKAQFLKLFIIDTVRNVVYPEIEGEKLDGDKDLGHLIKTLYELPVDEYEQSLMFFIREYYRESGMFFPYNMKLYYSRTLGSLLKKKYPEGAQEIKVYAQITQRLMVNRKYALEDD